MSQFQVGTDRLERRIAERRVDIDPTVPNRRKEDRRDEVIRPATDARPMANTLVREDFVQSVRRFPGNTDFGVLA